MDHLTASERSALMSRVGKSNTAPEIVVRKVAHALGYRFRLHRRDLPGCPDIVFPRLHKVIFVHGCFWHGHAGCPKGKPPATRQAYWLPKFARNTERDDEVRRELARAGWRVGVVWECETRDRAKLQNR